jgi:hypothetical protein
VFAFGVCDARVLVGDCGDGFEMAGEGEFFTAEFEAGGAVAVGAGCTGVGRTSWGLFWAGAAEDLGAVLDARGCEGRAERFASPDGAGGIFV